MFSSLLYTILWTEFKTIYLQYWGNIMRLIIKLQNWHHFNLVVLPVLLESWPPLSPFFLCQSLQVWKVSVHLQKSWNQELTSIISMQDDINHFTHGFSFVPPRLVHMEHFLQGTLQFLQDLCKHFIKFVQPELQTMKELWLLILLNEAISSTFQCQHH